MKKRKIIWKDYMKACSKYDKDDKMMKSLKDK